MLILEENEPKRSILRDRKIHKRAILLKRKLVEKHPYQKKQFKVKVSIVIKSETIYCYGYKKRNYIFLKVHPLKRNPL